MTYSIRWLAGRQALHLFREIEDPRRPFPLVVWVDFFILSVGLRADFEGFGLIILDQFAPWSGQSAVGALLLFI